MGQSLIVVNSITYAMKGRGILTRNGIIASIERTPRNFGKGCGYSIYVPYHTDRAEKLLRQSGIPVSGRAERDGRP